MSHHLQQVGIISINFLDCTIFDQAGPNLVHPDQIWMSKSGLLGPLFDLDQNFHYRPFCFHMFLTVKSHCYFENNILENI